MAALPLLLGLQLGRSALETHGRNRRQRQINIMAGLPHEGPRPGSGLHGTPGQRAQAVAGLTGMGLTPQQINLMGPQAAPTPVSVSPGSALVNPQTGQEIYQRPPTPKDNRTSLQKNFDAWLAMEPGALKDKFYDSMVRPNTSISLQSEKPIPPGDLLKITDAEGNNPPAGATYAWLRETSDRQWEVRKAPSELNIRAGGFLVRMRDSGAQVGKYETDNLADLVGPRTAAAEWFLPENLKTAAMSEPARNYVTEARNWISGVLRYDSGAATPDSEVKRYFTTYFASFGDGGSTIAIKARMRAAVEQAMENVAKRLPPNATQEQQREAFRQVLDGVPKGNIPGSTIQSRQELYDPNSDEWVD